MNNLTNCCAISSCCKKPYLIALLIFHSICFAGIFDDEIKVKEFLCDQKTKRNLYPNIFDINTFTIKDGVVYQKIETLKDGTVMKGRLLKLSNCIILDNSNWKCGGDSWVDASGRRRLSASDQVIKGKYFFTNGTTIDPTEKLEGEICRTQIN